MNPRHVISDWLWTRTIQRHRSRMSWRMAPRYTQYWNTCRSAYNREAPPAGELSRPLVEFHRDGMTSFWTPETERIAMAMFARIRAREENGDEIWDADHSDLGNRNYNGALWADFPELERLFRGTLGTFLEHAFGSHFKIFFCLLFRSEHRPEGPAGSALWHSDAGPGTCINVMFYLHETTAADGTLRALPWDQSKKIFRRERRATREQIKRFDRDTVTSDPLARREILCRYYEQAIDRNFSSAVRDSYGRAGTVVPFLNNTLHRGGCPSLGSKRYAIVCHCYPSMKSTDFALYARKGIAKTASYPNDPSLEF